MGLNVVEVRQMDDEIVVEWKLEIEEFEFAGCMDNHITT